MDIITEGQEQKPQIKEELRADEAKLFIYLRRDEAGNFRAVSRDDFHARRSAASVAPPHLSNGAYQGPRSKLNLGFGGRPATPEAENDPAASQAPPAPLFASGTNNGDWNWGDYGENLDLKLPPSVTGPVKHKSILKPPDVVSTIEKKVRVLSIPEIRFIPPSPSTASSFLPDYNADAPDTSPPPVTNSEPTNNAMSESQGRPKLKLSFTKTNIHTDAKEPLQTPASASHIRTPSIKLKFSTTPKESTKPAVKGKKDTPKSSNKKRKLTQQEDSASEDELSRPAPVRKLTLKAPPKPVQQGPAPTLKLKYKGKLPKRPLGVGYDSENDETERDPVILEAFMLRMPPGPDRDYVHKAIADGTVGISRAQGGADVQIRMLDTHGRRGIVTVQRRMYAVTMVDLPCIVEGMKSWDRKGWIKSVDICQMLLVLGRCNGDDEARNYQLPPDVDPKTYQYAHGITAPMRWVRKRRFARTKRAKVDDIEAIERRVNALLAGDAEAVDTSYTLYDHDPREDAEGEESGEFESDGDEEMEGEEDYFAPHGDAHGGNLEHATYQEDEIAELEAMMEDNDDEDDRLPEPKLAGLKESLGLHPPDEVSSFAVTSTSASPSATAAHTPASGDAGGVEEGEGSSDDEEEDESDRDEEDDEEDEGDENRQQALDRIEDLKKKIREQTEVMRSTENSILRKKIAGKIRGFEGDVEQIRRGAGLGDEDEDEDEDAEDGDGGKKGGE